MASACERSVRGWMRPCLRTRWCAYVGECLRAHVVVVANVVVVASRSAACMSGSQAIHVESQDTNSAPIVPVMISKRTSSCTSRSITFEWRDARGMSRIRPRTCATHASGDKATTAITCTLPPVEWYGLVLLPQQSDPPTACTGAAPTTVHKSGTPHAKTCIPEATGSGSGGVGSSPRTARVTKDSVSDSSIPVGCATPSRCKSELRWLPLRRRR